MATLKEKAASIGIRTALSYIEKDPENNLSKIVDWLYKVDGDETITSYLDVIGPMLKDKNNNWTKLIYSLFTDVDTGVRSALFENFVLNGMVLSAKKREKVMQENACKRNRSRRQLYQRRYACRNK